METTYAYLAGAVDVDGFISISRQSYMSRDRVELFHYFATVGFSDASPIVPNLLHELFPGHLYQSQPKRPTYTAFYYWRATRTRAREPLLRFLPHLRLKRRQAELTLELIDLLEQQNAAENKPLNLEEDAARRVLYEEVARLNEGRRRRKYRIEAPPAPTRE